MHEKATSTSKSLEVHQQLKGGVYRDVVRIAEKHRRYSQGRLAPEGTIRVKCRPRVTQHGGATKTAVEE